MTIRRAEEPSLLTLTSFVLGIAGGVFALIGSAIVLFVGGVGALFDTTGFFTITILSWLAIALAVLGIVGGILTTSNKIVAGVLMMISGIFGIIILSIAYLIGGILLIVASIIIFLDARSTEAAEYGT